jgi:hypothetical protein
MRAMRQTVRGGSELLRPVEVDFVRTPEGLGGQSTDAAAAKFAAWRKAA